MKLSFSSGFTLIELMVTVAMVAITLTLGVPGIRDTIQSNRLTTSANQFVSALNLARSEAVKRGVRITVRRTSDDWEMGWQVFTDGNPTGTKENTDTVLQSYSALPAKYTLQGNNNFVNFISFLPSGESSNMGSFAICANSTRIQDQVPQKNTSRLIIVNKVGRVRLGIDRDHNGVPEKEDGTNLSSCLNP